jgi:hypothetical protein
MRKWKEQLDAMHNLPNRRITQRQNQLLDHSACCRVRHSPDQIATLLGFDLKIR